MHAQLGQQISLVGVSQTDLTENFTIESLQIRRSANLMVVQKRRFEDFEALQLLKCSVG